MITEPASAPDHVDIRDLVRDVASTTFTSEQVRVAAATAHGYDEAAWRQLVDLGWTGLTLPEAAGGEDLGVYVACLVHRELGARLAPSPYLATAGLAASALTTLGDDALTADVLGEVARGETTAALVLGHGRGWPVDGVPGGLTASETPEGWVVDGAAELVLDGLRADLLVTVARVAGSQDWRLFSVDPRAGSVTGTTAATVDSTRVFADLVLDRAPARPLSSGPLPTDRVAALVDRTVVPLAAEMVGAAVTSVQLTLDYLATRHQFGRPIGSFQALKHRCADAAVSVTVAQETLFAAAEMVDAGDAEGLQVLAPLLLAQSAAAFRHATEEAIQLHGGVGFTDEVDIGLYYKRALVDSELISSVVDAQARLDIVRGGSR